MSIESVDLERALESATYAQQMLRSGKVSTEQKGQLVAKWGAENVNRWLSVDTTEYQIDDSDYNTSKEAGKETAIASTGYDGHKSYGSVVNTAISTGGAVAARAIAPSAFGQLSAIACAIISSVIAAKYYIEKPNKEQHSAAENLMEQEFPEAQGSLSETQGIMTDASEEITELTEEAESINDEANQKIEEDKTMFDFYKQQYDALKAKKESGEALTPDEQALMKQLAPLMEDLNEDITTISEDTSDDVNELNDNIAEYQDTFDESAETIAEVEGLTDYAEGFDENARTMMYVEGAGQCINSVSAGIAAARLYAMASGTFGATTAFAVLATAASVASGIASGQQFSWASDMSKEIDMRRETQDKGTQTSDMYDEELENYAANMEIVDDLELEIPEDIEVPSDDAGEGEASMMSIAADAGETDEQGLLTPMGTPIDEDKSQSTTDKNHNSKNADEDDKNDNDKKKVK